MFAYIALGSNIDARSEYIRQAIKQVEEKIGPINAVSALYETKPLVLDGEDSTMYLTYYNAAISCETKLAALDIIEEILKIEDSLGRVRTPSRRWEPRTIDLDLIFLDQMIIHTEKLTLPHPGVLSRDFVLVPLNDLDPEIIHPETGKTVAFHLKELMQTGERYIIGLAPTSIFRGKKNEPLFLRKVRLA